MWIYDLATGRRTRLTLEGGGLDPIWMPDGERVTFRATRDGLGHLYSRFANGSGEAEQLTAEPVVTTTAGAHSWSPDGSVLAYYDGNPRSIRILRRDGDGRAEPFLVRPFNERSPTFSPDGNWLAYVSDESREDEVYVTPYPGPGGRELVSLGGGREPIWSRDGRELFYRNNDVLMVVPVETEGRFTAGTPERLFEGLYVREAPPSGSLSYDVAPDGQRFLMVKAVGQNGDTAAPDIIWVQNWFEELKERVPVP